jgi:hypothetical protein
VTTYLPTILSANYFYFLLLQYSELYLLVMKVFQSVQIFKIGKRLEISVLGSPDVKKVRAHGLYVCTTGLMGKGGIQNNSRTVCRRAMNFGMVFRIPVWCKDATVTIW